MPDSVPTYEIRKGLRGSRVHFVCPACANPYSANLSDAGSDFTCPTCGRVMIVPGHQEAAEHEQAEQAREAEKRAQREQDERRKIREKEEAFQKTVRAAEGKAMVRAERERQAFLHPVQAARAERVAKSVRLNGNLGGAFIAILGLFGAVVSIVSIVGIVFLPGAILTILIGCLIVSLSDALAAHLRNAAHQTRMLARLVDVQLDKGPDSKPAH